MSQLGFAAADLERHRAADIGLFRQCAGRDRRRLVAGDPVGGAGGETHSDIILGDDSGPVLLERLVSAGVIAMEMRVDQILDRQRRDRADRRLDLVVQRRELPVHHDDAVAADRDRDVAALSFQPIGIVAEVDGLDLDLREIDVLLRVCGTR